jgi:Mg2+-importing ATPase
VTMRIAKVASLGLTSQEAEARLLEFGPNDPALRRRRSRILDILLLFANPLVLILLIAAGLSAILGEPVNAAIIATIVALSFIVNFVQTYRSQRAIDRLREGVASTATVLRDGRWQEVSRRKVVPGDLVRLTAGDLVPADARVLNARDLHVHEASLTGESLPVEKTAVDPSRQNADPHGMVFLGTSVVSGTATAFVVATGSRTRFGEIAVRLATRPLETEFERGLRRFGFLIMQTVLFLVLFIVIVSIIFHRPAFESLLFAVSLAVGLTPEFLPMITAVTLTEGAVRMSRRKVIVKHLAAIQNFGSIDVLCSDKTGTLTAGEMMLDRSVDAFGGASDEAFVLAYINSKLETGIRSPLDAAILAHPPPATGGYEKRDEIPFDFERRRLSVVIERSRERQLICKGAPEGIFPLVCECRVGGSLVPFDAATRARCVEIFEHLCGMGLRVLAVAERRLDARDGYSREDERDLTLVGFVTFSDPPLDDAHEAIEAMQRDGVEVKILTGDNELVAREICGEVGLNVSEIVLGSDLDRLGDAALGHLVERTTVFARMTPGQKNRILAALKHRSHVVGYLGDGINDAPSLHAADVGISVAHAVDVARDAADIILLEPGLRVLHNGILEGRRAFGNVMKYLLMGTSSNFGNMFSMAAASLFLPFLPMLPTQILLNNFLYDLAQMTIPTDRVDESYMRKPQRWDIRVIRRFMVYIGPLSSLYDFLTFFVLLSLLHATEALFHSGWFVESLATQTLVLFVIRTAGNPLRSRPSTPLAITTIMIVGVGTILPFTPLAGLLSFVPLPGMFFAFLAGVTTTYLLLVERVKRWLLHAAAIQPSAGKQQRPLGIGAERR